MVTKTGLESSAIIDYMHIESVYVDNVYHRNLQLQ